MEKGDIVQIMDTQHALIESMFRAFKNSVLEGKNAKHPFGEFEKELKNHFLIEEKAIFGFAPKKNSEILGIIKKLEEEHIAMLSALKSFSDDFKNISKKKLEDFEKLLAGHRKLEDQVLYPKMDTQLSKTQIKLLVARIYEVEFKKTGRRA